MKAIFVVAAACLAIACSGLAVAKTTGSAPLNMTMSGEGRWAVRCTFENANGNIDREEFKGGKAGPVVFSGVKLANGTCEYKAASDKPLTVAVEGEGWACPVGFTAETKCERAIAPGASGSFRLLRH